MVFKVYFETLKLGLDRMSTGVVVFFLWCWQKNFISLLVAVRHGGCRLQFRILRRHLKYWLGAHHFPSFLHALGKIKTGTLVQRPPPRRVRYTVRPSSQTHRPRRHPNRQLFRCIFARLSRHRFRRPIFIANPATIIRFFHRFGEFRRVDTVVAKNVEISDSNDDVSSKIVD